MSCMCLFVHADGMGAWVRQARWSGMARGEGESGKARGDNLEATVLATDSGKGNSREGEGRQWTVRVGVAEVTVDGKWVDSDGQWTSGWMVDGGGW